MDTGVSRQVFRRLGKEREMVRKGVVGVAGLGALVILLGGCASMQNSLDEAERKSEARREERLRVEEERAMRQEIRRPRYLEVTSEPDLARVYVNEIDVGLTPVQTRVDFTLHSYDPPYSLDTFEVTVTKEGYEKVTRVINFADFQPVENKGPFTSLDTKGVAFFLPGVGKEGEVGREVKTGTISVRSEPDGAEIYLDSGYIGATPKLHIRVPAGMHQIKLVRRGYKDWGRSLNLIADYELVVEAAMEKQ